MASHPFDDNDPEFKKRIETRAYHLWEADGRPNGRHDEYWERARELENMAAAGPTGQMTIEESAAEPIEEASIQENLGEFPDRFADQGEKSATPKAKAPARPRKKAEAEPGALPEAVEDATPAPAEKKPAAKPKGAKPAKA